MGMNIMRMKGRAKMMRTIKVTGKGKIVVKPDMIRLYVNKEELCHEYEDTLRRSTEDTELLKDLFENLGFQRKDLRSACVSKSQFFVSYSVSKRVCCHCGARHNDDMDLCGTVCRCSNRLRASGTHQYCALTKS